jgi:hypothetical protein
VQGSTVQCSATNARPRRASRLQQIRRRSTFDALQPPIMTSAAAGRRSLVTCAAMLLLRCALALAAVASSTPPAVASTQSTSSSTADAASTSSAASPSWPASTAVMLDAVTPLTRLTFASCNRADQVQPMWPTMQERAPQLFVWLGDVVGGCTT